MMRPLQQRFIIGIKMARFNISKSLEDYRITPERNAMAARWTLVRKKGGKVRKLLLAKTLLSWLTKP